MARCYAQVPALTRIFRGIRSPCDHGEGADTWLPVPSPSPSLVVYLAPVVALGVVLVIAPEAVALGVVDLWDLVLPGHGVHFRFSGFRGSTSAVSISGYAGDCQSPA